MKVTGYLYCLDENAKDWSTATSDQWEIVCRDVEVKCKVSARTIDGCWCTVFIATDGRVYAIDRANALNNPALR